MNDTTSQDEYDWPVLARSACVSLFVLNVLPLYSVFTRRQELRLEVIPDFAATLIVPALLASVVTWRSNRQCGLLLAVSSIVLLAGLPVLARGWNVIGGFRFALSILLFAPVVLATMSAWLVRHRQSASLCVFVPLALAVVAASLGLVAVVTRGAGTAFSYIWLQWITTALALFGSIAFRLVEVALRFAFWWSARVGRRTPPQPPPSAHPAT